MFNAGALTFQEFAMDERLPLAAIQDAVLDFLRGRNDVVVFGAQAVNEFPERLSLDLFAEREFFPDQRWNINHAPRKLAISMV